MDENTPIIHGLETQARSLTSQLAENNHVRFFIATQSLKPLNQIHLVQYNEDLLSQSVYIFPHPNGEIWKLNSSPHDSRLISTCYNTLNESQTSMKTSLLTLPEELESYSQTEHSEPYQSVEVLNTELYGNEIKTTEFHPSDSSLLASVIDNKIVVFNRGEASTRVACEINAKNSPKFTTGKWSQHHQGNQFIVLYEQSIKCYDIKDSNHCIWTIDEAHSQLVRDLDCNPNKQCHIVTGGDDGSVKVWDCRNIKQPVFTRTDHSHWVWSVRFNTFHDQLILSSSSDGKVMLTCAGSVSSEVENEDTTKKRIPDGLLQTYEQHEDSVYCVEWSSSDPWIFASLSYDGRMIISRVPKQYKYQII